MKLKSLIKEKTGDKIKIKADMSKYKEGSRNLHDRENIKIIDGILKKQGFKLRNDKENNHWYYGGNKYERGYYRLTGDIQYDYIEMEKIPLWFGL